MWDDAPLPELGDDREFTTPRKDDLPPVVGGNGRAPSKLIPDARPDEPEWELIAVEDGLGYGPARWSGMGESKSDSAIRDLVVESDCFRGTTASHDVNVTGAEEESTGIPAGTAGGTVG